LPLAVEPNRQITPGASQLKHEPMTGTELAGLRLHGDLAGPRASNLELPAEVPSPAPQLQGGAQQLERLVAAAQIKPW
jgi:hypothetical protein